MEVLGFAQLRADLKTYDKHVKKEINADLRKVVDPIAQTAADTAASEGWGARTAAGIRSGTRAGQPLIRQRLGKTTGTHPQFGSLQMRKALLPAVTEAEPDIRRGINAVLTRNARRFNS